MINQKSVFQILFLATAPKDSSPSQRFRIEQYLPYLEKYHPEWRFSYYTFFKKKDYLQFKKGTILSKVAIILKGFILIFLKIYSFRKFDVAVINRESTPVGYPIIEFILKFLFGLKLVYQFDDAIWYAPFRNDIFQKLKYPGKTKLLCRWANTVIVGNDYLASFAKNYNNNVVVIPTVVDTTEKYNFEKIKFGLPPTLGWTGSSTTLTYLQEIIPLLVQLQKKYQFNFIIIADINPDIEELKYQFIRWSANNEAIALKEMDVGLMPLPNNKWTQGKCGFKAVQYMAVGLPAIVSNVGVNRTIVEHKINGFVCSTLEDWGEFLEKILKEPQLLKKLADKNREKIKETYSVQATFKKYFKVIRG